MLRRATSAGLHSQMSRISPTHWRWTRSRNGVSSSTWELSTSAHQLSVEDSVLHWRCDQDGWDKVLCSAPWSRNPFWWEGGTTWQERCGKPVPSRCFWRNCEATQALYATRSDEAPRVGHGSKREDSIESFREPISQHSPIWWAVLGPDSQPVRRGCWRCARQPIRWWNQRNEKTAWERFSRFVRLWRVARRSLSSPSCENFPRFNVQIGVNRELFGVPRSANSAEWRCWQVCIVAGVHWALRPMRSPQRVSLFNPGEPGGDLSYCHCNGQLFSVYKLHGTSWRLFQHRP